MKLKRAMRVTQRCAHSENVVHRAERRERRESGGEWCARRGKAGKKPIQKRCEV